MGQRSRKRGRRARAGPAARVAAQEGAAASKRTAAPSRGAGADPAAAPERAAAGERKAAAAGESPRGTVGGWRVEPRMSRSERRDAEVRAGLTPIAAGERPAAIVVGAVVAALLGIGNLVAFLTGVKIGGKHPAASGIVVFTILMLACAAGMWRLWYGAVLGFMALLAIITVLFALLLIEASNVLGVLVALLIICGAGYLFFKLVRVLSRIQMPQRPGR